MWHSVHENAPWTEAVNLSVSTFSSTSTPDFAFICPFMAPWQARQASGSAAKQVEGRRKRKSNKGATTAAYVLCDMGTSSLWVIAITYE
jgi:hypothetical protein